MRAPSPSLTESLSLKKHGWLPDHAIEWLMLAAILLLAGLLRLGAPGTVEFKRDEAALSLLALDIASGRDLPLLGIGSSVGVPNSPLSAWVLAIPYALSHDPQVATAFVGLLNVAAVLGVYVLARRYYGPWAALVAGLTLAAGPWAVIYSRKLWAQDLLPSFAAAALAAGILGFLEKKRAGQLLFLPLLAVAGQIHFAALVLLPAAALLVWFGRRRLTRWFWFSLPLALLLFAPYAFGLARAGLLDPAALRALRASSGVEAVATDPLASLHYVWLTVTGAELHALAGPERFGDYLAGLPDLSLVSTLAGIALLSSGGWLFVRSLRWRDARSRLDAVLLVWASAAPLLFLLPWTPVFPHYFIPILPACALIVGAAAADLVAALRDRPYGRWVLAVIGAAFALVIAGEVLALTSLLQFVGTTATPGGFGVPLGRLMAARDLLLADDPADVIVGLDDPDAPIVWRALLYDMPSARFDGEPVTVYPAGSSLRLDECEPGESGIELRPGEGCLMARPATAFDPEGWTLVDTQPFANGAQINAFRWDVQSSCLDLAWTAAGPVSADYHVAVQLVDGSGAPLASADALGWPGAYWRAGDTITRSFCASDPVAAAAASGARIGFYTYADGPDGRAFFNVDVLDAAGAPAVQQVPLTFDGSIGGAP